MTKLVTLVACAVLAACSADPESGPDRGTAGTAPDGTLGDVQAGMRLGDTGPEVQRLHATLAQFGYLPNAALRETHPDWTPVVPREPAAADRFDEVTEAGVRAFQARARLEPSGVVDEATAEALSSRKCDFPEYGSRDESWKFALYAKRWRRFPLTWKLAGGLPTGLTDPAFDTRVRAAFQQWQDHSPFTFTRVASNAAADIVLYFGVLCCQAGVGEEPAGNALASAIGDADASGEIYAGRINFRSTLVWNPNAPAPVNLHDVALHEIGHVLGLAHSDPPDSNCTVPGQCAGGPVMWYMESGQPSLREDDIIAIHARYPGYVQTSRRARTVTAGGDGSMWFLGTNNAPKGANIYKWTPARQYEDVPSQGAISVAVESNGVAWAADNTGQVYFTSFMGWIPIGAPRYGQVAAAMDKIWALSITRDSNYEGDVYQFSDPAMDFQLVSGIKATNIAVDSRGRAWALRKNGDVYRRDGSAWTRLPKAAPPLTQNLRAGANGAIFVNGLLGSGWATYIWNQQEGNAGADIPAREEWLQIPGASSHTYEVTSSRDGRLWAVTANAAAQNYLWTSIR